MQGDVIKRKDIIKAKKHGGLAAVVDTIHASVERSGIFFFMLPKSYFRICILSRDSFVIGLSRILSEFIKKFLFEQPLASYLKEDQALKVFF